MAIIILVTLQKNNSVRDIYDVTPDDNIDNLGSHQILTKKDWNGRDPKSYLNITHPVRLVIIKHTGGGVCKNFQTCAGKIQTIQSTSMGDGWPDIYCNFLIGGDGNIYVGRGWDVQNEQRDSTIDIVFIGNFDIDPFDDIMAEAALLLIEDGVKNNKIEPDYKVICHNQTSAVNSPGKNVIKAVVKWPHYNGGLFFPKKLVSEVFQNAHTNKACAVLTFA